MAENRQHLNIFHAFPNQRVHFLKNQRSIELRIIVLFLYVDDLNVPDHHGQLAFQKFSWCLTRRIQCNFFFLNAQLKVGIGL